MCCFGKYDDTNLVFLQNMTELSGNQNQDHTLKFVRKPHVFYYCLVVIVLNSSVQFNPLTMISAHRVYVLWNSSFLNEFIAWIR